MGDPLAAEVPQVAGRRCQTHVARLSQIHRIMGSPGYHSAVEYVTEQLRTIGLTDIQVERFRMDGAYAYGDWVPPVAWTPIAAELWVESQDRFRLCDFAETPICLHVGSQSTPPGGLVGDLIDIGAGLSETDYAGQDISGRIVLTSGNVREVYEEAVRRRGAIGILSDCMPWQAPGIGRSSLDQPDLVSYNKLNVRQSEIGSGVFAFSLSARQGARLRVLLRQGPVRVRADVDATATAGVMEVVNARLPGQDPTAGELVLVTHLCHPQPGANDNATGPALTLELMRTLLAEQQAGRLPQLRHTLRLLFVPEAYGTLAWLLESQAPRSPMRLALNLDMVGGDTAQTRGHLWLDQTPWSAPSYLNDLVAHLLATVATTAPDGWQYGVREHMGGSDHILFLPPEIGVPAIMLGHEPDRFYHSDQDTVDKTSPREFEKVGRVALATLLTVDSLDTTRARRLAFLVYQGAIKRLVDDAQAIIQTTLAGHNEPVIDYSAALGVLLAKEQAALHSILDHALPAARHDIGRETKTLATRLAGVCAAQVELVAQVCGPARPTPTTATDGHIPRRLFRGPISSHLMGLSRFFEALGQRADFYRARSQEDRGFVRWMFEASNLIDGRRCLAEIQTILVAEFGPTVARRPDLDRFVDDLVTTGMADYLPPSPSLAGKGHLTPLPW